MFIVLADRSAWVRRCITLGLSTVAFACTSAPDPVAGGSTGAETSTGATDGGTTGGVSQPPSDTTNASLTVGMSSSTGEDPDTGTDTGGEPARTLEVQGEHFVDEHGRVVVLRGLNVAGNSKVPPFLPVMDTAQLDALEDFGINVIRLLINWEAYEGTEGVYDGAYLDAITEVADAAWERDIFVIIDFHQDGFSRYLAGGCGDGFPAWAHPPAMALDTPDNGPGCVNWAVQMTLDPRVHSAFEAFYADDYGVRAAYLELWSGLAAHFASHDGVIGYDPINEPWGFEDTELAPLYEDVAAVIRARHPEAILFIEGHVTTNNGALATQLPPPTFDNYAYAPHFYEGAVLATHIWSGITTATDVGFTTMTGSAQSWGVPLFVGEFGTHGDTLGGDGYMDLQYERLDDYFASGVQWNWTPDWNEQDKDGWNDEDLSIVDGRGSLRPNYRIRAYPRAIAGVPQSFVVDADLLTLEWEHDPALGETELFVPAQSLWGTNDLVIGTSPGLVCEFDAVAQTIACASADAQSAELLVSPS